MPISAVCGDVSSSEAGANRILALDLHAAQRFKAFSTVPVDHYVCRAVDDRSISTRWVRTKPHGIVVSGLRAAGARPGACARRDWIRLWRSSIKAADRGRECGEGMHINRRRGWAGICLIVDD